MKAALAMALLLAGPSCAQTGSGAEPVRYMGGVSIDLNAPDGKLRPASWQEALSAIAARLKAAKPERIGAIAGELASVEDMFALKLMMEALGSRNIDVREEENRLALAGTVEANDEVFFFGAGTAKKKVRILKTRCFQAGGGSFGNRSGGTGSEAGGDFDELFIDIAGDFFFSVRARGLGAHGCGE